ncbi:nucleotidyltransferase domain-containing protein [Mesorhizobium sp. M0142]|uniref:nucleotidyltransferase domain-containing protein n=1 Tax=unclassified Mesorhizobium TaxID=325217 RepID=UPI0033384092
MARSTAQSALRYPLTIMLGTEASVRLLRELSRHGGLLSSPLLATRSGLARASVWSALATLEGIGIVSSEGTGRARLYRLNGRHPLATSLEALFEQEALRYSNIRAVITEAVSAVRPKVLAAWIYGSVARGEDRPDSDLDIAVVTPSEKLDSALQEIREALVTQGQKLGFNPSVVGLTPEDVARLSSTRDPWWGGVEANALLVLGSRPDELATKTRRQALA